MDIYNNFSGIIWYILEKYPLRYVYLIGLDIRKFRSFAFFSKIS